MITSWSIIMAIVISSIYICLFNLIMRKTSYIKAISIPVLLSFLILIILRLLIPLELNFTKVVVSTALLPKINSFFQMPLYKFNNRISINIFSILILIWLLGATTNIIKLFRSQYYLNKSFKNLESKKDIDQKIWDNLSKEYKISKHLRIIETSAVSTPFVYGLIFPTIVFPIFNFNTDEQYFILKHELEHLKEKHIWVKVIIELICAIYWWNPFVYILRKQADNLLEINVDIEITRSWGQDKTLTYLEFLLSIFKKSLSRSTQKNIPLSLDIVYNRSKSAFLQRLDLLFTSDKLKYSVVKTTVGTITLVFLLLISFSFILQPRYPLPSEYNQSMFVLTPDNAYIVKTASGYYEIFSREFGYLTTISEIEEPYSELPIFKTKGEVGSK